MRHRGDYSSTELEAFFAKASKPVQTYEASRLKADKISLIGAGGLLGFMIVGIIATVVRQNNNPMILRLTLPLWLIGVGGLLTAQQAHKSLQCPACNTDVLHHLEHYCPQCGREMQIADAKFCCKRCNKSRPLRAGRRQNFKSKFCSRCGVKFSSKLIR